MPVYVQHEVLGKVNDVFDAHAIWQAPGLALFARRPLLRDLLERSPRELRGRAATRCFAHVTLMLPQEEVDDDRHLTRGARVRDLADGLAALHQKDFGDLLAGDDVRYHVVGTERLEAGEVEVKFGHAVYLPAPGEQVAYNVSVSRDSAVWKTVCPIYPHQRLTLVGYDDHAATWAAPGWPFGADGAILIINDEPDAPIEVQVRPKDAFDCSYDAAAGYYTIKSRRGAVDASGAALRLLMRVTPTQTAATPRVNQGAPAAASAVAVAAHAAVPASMPAARSVPATTPASRPLAASADVDPAATHPSAATVVRHDDAYDGAASHYAAPVNRGASVTAGAASASAASPMPGASLFATPARPAVWKPRAVTDPELTALPQARPQTAHAGAVDAEATYAPVPRQRVALVALALPRLSRYRDTGAQALEIGLNRAFAPTAPGEDAVLSFAVDDQDALHAITAAGRERIAAPATFSPIEGSRIELAAVPAQMADRYCAVLRLPQAPALPVAAGARFVFGRGAAMLAALRVLDSPRFVKHGAGTPASSADRLGLSRTAFSFEAAPDGWLIARLSATQALYHLDADLGFVAVIDAASPDAPYRLPAGHHLVAGHYVLRFDA